jgi:PPOX class probable F420-dependent enzyme
MDLARALEIVGSRNAGAVATTKRDGRPQLSNINYALGEDGIIRISVTDGRAKVANVRRDPRASLYVSREDHWAYLVVDADAELSAVAAERDDATVEELIELFRAVQGEHPDWDDYRRAMVEDRRLVLRLRPTHAYGMWPDG